MLLADGFLRWSLVVVCFLVVVGCGSDPDRYETVPVSGVVTCKGKPVANGMVNFTPMAEQGRAEGRPGRVALGKTDKDGRFKLTTYVNDDGAIVGRHKVTVGFGFDEGTGSDPNKAFPCRNSSMEMTVEAGMGEVKVDF